jgi:hypothetical protein
MVVIRMNASRVQQTELLRSFRFIEREHTHESNGYRQWKKGIRTASSEERPVIQMKID